jgi:hypothetical protein
VSSGNFWRGMKGWLAGCGAATALIVGFTWIVVAVSSGDLNLLAGGTAALWLPALLVFLVTSLLTVFPAAAVIWLSERFGIRSIWFFGSAGAVMGALGLAGLTGLLSRAGPTYFPSLFVVAGFVAGMAYWRVAGRHAGRGVSRGAA